MVSVLRVGRTATIGLVAVLHVGCYTYTSLETRPAPQTRVALVLSDEGRVGARTTLGAGVARVEGAVVDATDTDYTVRVAEVTDIRGGRTNWTGETVQVQRSFVASAFERRFSKSRTSLLIGAFTAGLVAFAATRDLFGGGGPLIENPGGGGGGEQ